MPYEITYAPPSDSSHSDTEFVQLRKLAAARSIPGYATMRKDELKHALSAANRIVVQRCADKLND